MHDLTPKQIVAALDRYIVGQDDAKRSVAIAIRNRWRRQQLDDELRKEVAPKNIMMIGPTGVGKTEIARRLATLTGAPFIKVEATKYTEVGYYGRDVESMIRELVENAIGLVRTQELERVEPEARRRVEEKLLDLLAPPPASFDVGVDSADAPERYERTREKMRAMLAGGEMEQRMVELAIEQKAHAMMIPGMGPGGDSMDFDFQGMLEKVLPKSVSRRQMTVAEARRVIFEQECEAMINQEKVNTQAIELAENVGIIFIDEMDKVVSSEGVVNTRYGYVRTDHILFVAAGAFHKVKPSELMPELQGRFPIRVELKDLTKDDFVRILTEPKGSLTRQYTALMQTEGVELSFTPDAIDALASYAYDVNQSTQNIGARRLYTIMERLLEELSFEAPDMGAGHVEINCPYVRKRLDEVTKDEDLSKFIL
jgi:ATP-dependent HslUV protease ATP-binding subunit HslU